MSARDVRRWARANGLDPSRIIADSLEVDMAYRVIRYAEHADKDTPGAWQPGRNSPWQRRATAPLLVDPPAAMFGQPAPVSGSPAALVLMVGPPGSGKSTWISGRFPAGDVFSLDMFRRMLAGDVADQSATVPAVAMLRAVVANRMARRLTTVVDACNTRPEYREDAVALAREYGVPVLAVVLATPLEVCLVRNAARDITPAPAAPYPGANAAPVPPDIVARLDAEARETPPRVGEVDAVLTVADGRAVEWDGADSLPVEVLAEPWLADTLDAPARPRFVADPR